MNSIRALYLENLELFRPIVARELAVHYADAARAVRDGDGDAAAAEIAAPAEAAVVDAAPAIVPAPAPVATLPAGFATTSAGPFVLQTDVADPAWTAAVAQVAMALPAVWSERYGLPLPEPLAGTLVVYAREADFQALARAEGEPVDRGIRGSSRGERVALAIGGQPREDVTALLVHELAHLLARRAFGRDDLPPWLEEGLAEELALARQTKDGRLLPGTLRGRVRARALDASSSRPAFASRFEVSADGAYGALSSLLAAQRRGAMPILSKLLALPAEEFRRYEGRRDRYTASAFFVRFLLDGRERRSRAPFHAYLAAVAGGGPADGAALATALGEPLPLLERDFAAWLRLQATVNR
ncbi:MAG TPA: hypothetical protein VF121_14245, partial [Thermoanaerobaculia bacterium]|nr:hypothetical protein [Thermoanaerobaculia bacterium]